MKLYDMAPIYAILVVAFVGYLGLLYLGYCKLKADLAKEGKTTDDLQHY